MGDRHRRPPETQAALKLHKGAAIYVLGPEDAVPEAVFDALGKLGTVKRIAAADAVSTAITFARYRDGASGWYVVDPGHGLVFANARRPQDAAAAAPLSAHGKYGPLLLIGDEAGALPEPLQRLPAGHPTGLRRDHRPRPRRLQPRLDHR